MSKPKPKPLIREHNLILTQKAQIVVYAEQQVKVNYVHIAEWASQTFKIRTSLRATTIDRIIKCKHEYIELTSHERKSKSKHHRIVKNSTLETILRDWIIQ